MQGQCLCQAIQFSIEAPTVASAHCHCTYCQRAHGAAFVTWLIVPTSSFQLHAEPGQLQWFQSSKQSKRGFCGTCGSTLFFESTLCPDEVHVARANITGATDREPAYHCFVDQKANLVTVADDLIQLKSDSEELAHYQDVRTPT